MVTKTSNTNILQDKLDLYDQLISTIPEIERKGVTIPYTSHNGHMFTFLSPEGTMALRLAEKERNAFLKHYKTVLMESYGAVMKEYVKVPENLLKETNELKKYLVLSYEYIKTIKPKPTKKTIAKQ